MPHLIPFKSEFEINIVIFEFSAFEIVFLRSLV